MSSADMRHMEIIVIGARKGEDASLIDLIIKKMIYIKRISASD